ncbi:hypothetical protein IKG20_00575 [Candidatus Saccharibacteria bacterium]|nr:hypothetical protein [Candidatus Saccharibacteria bacterium]
MKTSDYITVGFIAIFVTILAYVAVNSFLGDPKTKSVKFEYLSGITGTLSEPDPEIFNAAAVNPTVEVYIGSCVDRDQDGFLDDDERRECGLDAMETNTGRTESDYLEQNQGLSNEQNEAINSQQGYASGTTADQRQAVEDSTAEYQQQQQSSQQNTSGDETARQETVSGS